MFRIKDADWNQADILAQPDRHTYNGIETVQQKIEYLLIQRRDSIGFVEMMRGKYRINDIEYIRKLIEGMTANEREKLIRLSFDELWEGLWGVPQEGGPSYRAEKEHAKQKFEALAMNRPNLKELLQEAPPAWPTPEWGFPKGRKDANESDYYCAMRELWEETNLREKDILPIRNLDPLEETFFGSNHVHYCHKYYLAFAPPGIGEYTLEEAISNNIHIGREIGAIHWMSLAEALAVIRPENVEKKELLLRVSSLLRNYCPLRLGGIREKRDTK